ncbi:flotillin-1 isoform X2 [Salvelinus namaycush]|nr:flotillin-1 isoform X2 [Salvelinus namaycush]
MISGGRVFVLPCVQKIQRISLNTLTLNVKSDKVYTRHGVPISVTGIAQMKIQGQNKQMLAAACQMFMGKSEGEIAQIALETLEGHQRAIIAHLTVEEIYRDRKKFSEEVFKVASSDLVNMGISVVSYTLKDVHDDQDYLHSLGKSRTAQVQKDARIGEAQFKRDAVIREAHAMQEKISAQYVNEIQMAKAQRDYELKKASYDIEVNTKKAESEMAYQLQVAKTKQRIEEEKMQVKVVERSQQIMLQEQEITRKEMELEAKVKKPAEAERYRLEKLAEAQRAQLIMEAEAEAESIRIKGDAEAFAVEAKGRAEAEQMAKKAEAFQQYKEGAMVDMLLEQLPLVRNKPFKRRSSNTHMRYGGRDQQASGAGSEDHHDIQRRRRGGRGQAHRGGARHHDPPTSGGGETDRNQHLTGGDSYGLRRGSGCSGRPLLSSYPCLAVVSAYVSTVTALPSLLKDVIPTIYLFL